ncbi:hypothetical protein H1R20_g16269, partial [Candolleomyces eurysporus]
MAPRPKRCRQCPDGTSLSECEHAKAPRKKKAQAKVAAAAKSTSRRRKAAAQLGPNQAIAETAHHGPAATYPPAAPPPLPTSAYAPGGNLGPTPAFNFPVYTPQSGSTLPPHAAQYAMFPQQYTHQGQVAPFVFASNSFDAGATVQSLQRTAPPQPSHTVTTHCTQLATSAQLGTFIQPGVVARSDPHAQPVATGVSPVPVQPAALAPDEPMIEDEPEGIEEPEDQEVEVQELEEPEDGGQPIYVPPGEPKPDKRLWPSDKAHPFGFIDGLAREWARQRKKGSPIIKQEYVSKSWEYWARELFTRAERMADAVSGWVYVAIQQPGSRGPFVHFASRRVRREAPDELAAVHNQVARMMAILKRGDRAQNLDLIRENEKVKDQIQSVEKRAFEAESELTRLRAELNARNQLLSMMYHKVQGSSDASDPASVE